MSENVTKMEKLLRQELTEMRGLLEMLQQESGLIAKHPDQLNEFAARKEIRLKKLEKFALTRLALLQHAGFSPDRSGMDRFVEGTGHNGVLLPLWNKLLDVTRECNDCNQKNAMLVDQSARGIRGALAILRGNLNQVTSTYSSDGYERNDLQSRTIARA